MITFNAPISIYIQNSAICKRANICKHKSTKDNIKYMPFWLDLTFINMLDDDLTFVAQIICHNIFTTKSFLFSTWVFIFSIQLIKSDINLVRNLFACCHLAATAAKLNINSFSLRQISFDLEVLSKVISSNTFCRIYKTKSKWLGS